MQVSMTVNGQLHRADVEPRLLLVDFIRETLKLTGTKIGCDTGQCGACVMQVDGRLTTSCSMLAVQADNAQIETIEGASTHGQLTSLQENLWKTHGLQCGFCTPGVVMTLKDLLQRNATPNKDEIRSTLDGNLCRCTGYVSILRAVEAIVIQNQQMAVKDPEVVLTE